MRDWSFLNIGKYMQSPQLLGHFLVASCLFPVPFQSKYDILTDMSVGIEDLNLSGIIKNRKLSRAISETRLEKIPDIFRMDLQKNTVGI